MHWRAYQALTEQGVPVEVVALCDINPANFNHEIKINVSRSNDVPIKPIDRCYTDVEEMLARENLDFVDICLPTFLHKISRSARPHHFRREHLQPWVRCQTPPRV